MEKLGEHEEKDGYFKSVVTGHEQPQQIVAITCPRCQHKGVLQQVGTHDTYTLNLRVFGLRRCPNPDCGIMIFYVSLRGETNQKPLFTFPLARLDFDSSNIPKGITSSFEEAARCVSHGSPRAAAMMIRRTLEEVCAHEKATGANLEKRLLKLKQKVSLPQGLLSSLDRLRFLGNDAGHIKARVYSEITTETVSVAFDLTKEILKSLYQLQALSDRLEALGKKPPEPHGTGGA